MFTLRPVSVWAAQVTELAQCEAEVTSVNFSFAADLTQLEDVLRNSSLDPAAITGVQARSCLNHTQTRIDMPSAGSGGE
jgi:hypothetical protein